MPASGTFVAKRDLSFALRALKDVAEGSREVGAACVYRGWLARVVAPFALAGASLTFAR